MVELPQMRYRLIVPTHGDAPHLERALTVFEEMVYPQPAERVLVVDGTGRIPKRTDEWEVWASSQQAGFCATYERVWRAARATDLDWVFLLENDFLIRQRVDLRPLAALLIHDPKIAQVALVRQPVNNVERAAGGLVESRPGEFTARHLSLVHHVHEYLEHGSFFTTNPCLFRSRLARQHPWPERPDQCEGHYGIGLREAGLRFALWGSGEPWVEHVGERTGFGY